MRRKQSGVTLVELMIAVGIVGILAAIAYPSYQSQVRRGNRVDAKAALMQASQEMEKCFTRFGRYLPTGVDQCRAYDQINAAGGRMSEKGKYQITFAVAVTRDTYQLQAAKLPNTGPDPECLTLTLDQTGRRGHTGSAPTAQTCW